MSSLGDKLATTLHVDVLRPQGFRKTRRVFKRTHVEFSEYYQLQGSAWNSPDAPWRFYLNCGIAFAGIPRRVPDRDFPHVHAWMRAGLFSARARSEYDVTLENLDATVAALVPVLEDVSNYFTRRRDVLRTCYQEQRYYQGFLADPELRA